MRKAIRYRLLGDRADKQKASTVKVAYDQLSYPHQNFPQWSKIMIPSLHHHFSPKIPSPMQTIIRTMLKPCCVRSAPASDLQPKGSVWAHAYQRLRATKSQLLATFEALVEEDAPSTASSQQRLSIAVAERKEDMLSK